MPCRPKDRVIVRCSAELGVPNALAGTALKNHPASRRGTGCVHS